VKKQTRSAEKSAQVSPGKLPASPNSQSARSFFDRPLPDPTTPNDRPTPPTTKRTATFATSHEQAAGVFNLETYSVHDFHSFPVHISFIKCCYHDKDQQGPYEDEKRRRRRRRRRRNIDDRSSA
jgi:hypothetical protein